MKQSTCYVYMFVYLYPWMIGFCVMHKCGNLNYQGAGEVMDTFSSERKLLLPVEMECAYVLEVQQRLTRVEVGRMHMQSNIISQREPWDNEVLCREFLRGRSWNQMEKIRRISSVAGNVAQLFRTQCLMSGYFLRQYSCLRKVE